MQTSDWAEDAHAFYVAYLRSILRGERHEDIRSLESVTIPWTSSSSGMDMVKGTTTTISLTQKFRSDSVLGYIDLKHWKVHDDDEPQQQDESDEANQCNNNNNPFALYEQIRGWQPFLRRIPDNLVPDCRLLTLIRWTLAPPPPPPNAAASFKELQQNHVSIVSRKQWAVMEYLRWEEGLYNDPLILKEVQSEVELLEKQLTMTEGEEATIKKNGRISQIYQGHRLLSIVTTLDRGRGVVWQGSESILPGTVVWQQLPYVVAPYDMPPSLQPDFIVAHSRSHRSVNTATTTATTSTTTAVMACFHCVRDLTQTTSNVVRDVALSCPKCHLVSYCSVACRQAHQQLHDQECDLLPHVIAICLDGATAANSVTTTYNIPVEPDNDDAVHNNSKDAPPLDHVAPFKALLVIRALLKASTHPDEWIALLDLESHVAETKLHHPLYYARSQSLSQYIVYHLLPFLNAEQLLRLSSFDSERLQQNNSNNIHTTTTTTMPTTQHRQDLIRLLVRIFCSIHVNAISLGTHAVGLFPGMSSMFNHSCNENLTHSWDDVNAATYNNHDVPVVGGILQFRAVQSVAPGDECFISYVSGLDLPTAERTRPLAYKFFTCTCPRCTSDTEQGRQQVLQEWKQTTEAITMASVLATTTNLTDTTTASSSVGSVTDDFIPTPMHIALLKKRCELANILFPHYHVRKGLTWEELGRALCVVASEQGDTLRTPRDALLLAREQYVICRGEASPLVQRVDSVLNDLSSSKGDETGDDGVEKETRSEIDANDLDDDLCISGTGWMRIIWEIKTWEPSSAEELETLADQIRNLTATTTADFNKCLQWAPGYRIWEVGYGIRTLIMSCRILESETTVEEVASVLEEELADAIQHVDRIVHDSNMM